MSATMESLKVDHKNISRLLGMLEEQAKAIEEASEPDYELIKEIIDYFLTYPDLCHHPKEDLVLNKLRRRAPEVAAAVGALDEEHKVLSEQLHEFSHAVANMLLEVEVPRDRLVRLAREFVGHERRHMAMEEKVFFAAAERHLTDEDWRDIDQRASRLRDPLSSTERTIRFAELRERMAL